MGRFHFGACIRRICHETVKSLIVKFRFHPVLPVRNKSGAYGRRTLSFDN
jgi:hypothetical protein